MIHRRKQSLYYIFWSLEMKEITFILETERGRLRGDICPYMDDTVLKFNIFLLYLSNFSFCDQPPAKDGENPHVQKLLERERLCAAEVQSA